MRTPRRLWPTLALAGIALVCTVFAGYFLHQHTRASAAMDNRALADAVASKQVEEDIAAAVESVMSYDYQRIAEHDRQVQRLLVTDEARDEYGRLYREVEQRAGKQKIVLKTQVPQIAVTELGERRARLLIFVEQTASRGDVADSSAGGGQLVVTASRGPDGRWRIAGLNSL